MITTMKIKLLGKFQNPARWRSPLSVVPRCSGSAARNNPV
jgi:hypothetical protein